MGNAMMQGVVDVNIDEQKQKGRSKNPVVY